jgi:hypothetical protein
MQQISGVVYKITHDVFACHRRRIVQHTDFVRSAIM